MAPKFVREGQCAAHVLINDEDDKVHKSYPPPKSEHRLKGVAQFSNLVHCKNNKNISNSYIFSVFFFNIFKKKLKYAVFLLKKVQLIL